MRCPAGHRRSAVRGRGGPVHGRLQRGAALTGSAAGASRQRGIALVVVLWLVVLITVIGSSHARNTRIETSLAFNHVGSAQARALAEMGQ